MFLHVIAGIPKMIAIWCFVFWVIVLQRIAKMLGRSHTVDDVGPLASFYAYIVTPSLVVATAGWYFYDLPWFTVYAVVALSLFTMCYIWVNCSKPIS